MRLEIQGLEHDGHAGSSANVELSVSAHMPISMQQTGPEKPLTCICPRPLHHKVAVEIEFWPLGSLESLPYSRKGTLLNMGQMFVPVRKTPSYTNSSVRPF